MRIEKKVMGLALAAALMIASIVTPASRAFAENQKQAPAYAGGIRHQNLSFYGVKPCTIVGSTTAVLCVAGEGFVDAICPSGVTDANGLLGAYTLAMDTPTAGTRAVTDSGYTISPEVTAYNTYKNIPPGGPCWIPPAPVRFVNGLVGVQNSTHSTVIYYHQSGGQNP